jgi:hypothetical protein
LKKRLDEEMANLKKDIDENFKIMKVESSDIIKE